MTTESSRAFTEKVRDYARPDVLVSTDWVAEHLGDETIRVVEADEDVLLYEVGHIPGAIKLDWHTDLQDSLARDFVSPQGFADLMESKGVSRDSTVVLYGDRNNWYATYTFWLFTMYGHPDVRVMDGGRTKWEAESRPWTRDSSSYPRGSYPVPTEINRGIRAFRDDARSQSESRKPLIDVRSPPEFKGELLHMVDYPQEGALRGGHIPGAANIPWGTAANPTDGTFKTAEELRAIYAEQNGITPGDEVITYCRIGERSSHTWFVLTYLLGYPSVRNYDGSWTEWGNLVGAPIEK